MRASPCPYAGQPLRRYFPRMPSTKSTKPTKPTPAPEDARAAPAKARTRTCPGRSHPSVAVLVQPQPLPTPTVLPTQHRPSHISPSSVRLSFTYVSLSARTTRRHQSKTLDTVTFFHPTPEIQPAPHTAIEVCPPPHPAGARPLGARLDVISLQGLKQQKEGLQQRRTTPHPRSTCLEYSP